MLFFYVRHGDPIYSPNQLTPLGERQAEAVGRRLAAHGIDKIFSSTSNRAIQTAQPTCEMLKKDMTLLDFANEDHAWMELAVVDNGSRGWLFHNKKFIKLFSEIRFGISLGVVKDVSYDQLGTLLVEVMPATLTLSSENTPKSESARDRLRAQKIQSILTPPQAGFEK